MDKLFVPGHIGSLEVPNRFVRSATWEGMATEEGMATPELIELLAELARGRVGMIIPGHAYVSPEGLASPRQLGVHSDETLPGLEKIATAIRENGSTSCLQLAHAGFRALTHITGLDAIGPSRQPDDEPPCEPMDQRAIRRTVQAFADAAARAKKAGFDAVQLHGAHGYLISQFISPRYNSRTDDWGGDTKKRAAFPLAVLRAVRLAVGDDYPVLMKINVADFVDGGAGSEHQTTVAKLLEEAGMDAFELSGGTPDSGKLIPVRPGDFSEPEKEAFYRLEADAFRAALQVPLILVGGVRSPMIAREIVSTGRADFVSMSRPLIREPHLIERWEQGDLRPSTCMSDNMCFKPARAGLGLLCYHDMEDTSGL